MIFPFIYLLSAYIVSIKKPHLGLGLLLFHYLIMMWVALRFNSLNYGFTGTVGTIFLYLLLFSNPVFRKKYFFKHISFYLIFNVLFLSYLLLLSIYHSADIKPFIDYFKNFFHYFLLIPMILAVFDQQRENYFFKFVGLIIVLEIFLVIGQIISPVIHNFLVIEFVEQSGGSKRIISEQIIKGKVAIGTFIRPANLGNFLAILVPALIYFLSEKFNGWKKMFLNLLIVLLIWVLFQTGIRTSIISFAFFLLTVFWILSKKKLFIILSLITVAFYVSFQYVKNISKNFDLEDGFQNPINRIINGIYRIFNPETSVLEDSTLSRTMNILSQINDFFLGSAVHVKGGAYNGVSSITDATLAFIFVEFGFITFLLCFIPFLYPIIYLKNNLSKKIDFKFSLALFGCLFLQTITDQGFFTVYTSALYFLICGLLMHRNRQLKPDFKSSNI